MARAKKGTQMFKMVSQAGTGFFFVGEKSTKHAARRMTLRKFDPIVNQYVLFTEQKLKSGRRT
jgi:large subunit ribosomal protein L33